MQTIKKALDRFKELVDSLECECDDYHGYTCPLHKDRELARKALKRFELQQPHAADADDRCTCRCEEAYQCCPLYDEKTGKCTAD